MLSLYHFLLFWIDGIVGPAVASWIRWLPALVGAFLWPVMVAVLDTSNRRIR
jgi:cell shape-determining protein MreD